MQARGQTAPARVSWRFARHYLEMVAAMAIGVIIFGGVSRGVLALAGIAFSATRFPELASLEMAFDMAAGMVLWMRRRGHGWTSTLEMAGVMFFPALVMFPALWLGVVTTDALLPLDHLMMLPLMLAVMLRHRGEYGC